MAEVIGECRKAIDANKNVFVDFKISNQDTNDVKKLLFLGSSCIYPKHCPQPIKEEYLGRRLRAFRGRVPGCEGETHEEEGEISEIDGRRGWRQGSEGKEGKGEGA